MYSTSGNLKEGINRDLGYVSDEKGIIVSNAGYMKINTKSVELARKRGRRDYQIIYVASGKVIFEDKDVKWEANPGTVKVYLPGEPQKYYCRASDKAEIYWVHFTGYDVENFLKECEVATKFIGVHNDLINELKICIEELQLKKKNFESLVNGIFMNISAKIGRYSAVKINRTDKALDELIKIINTVYIQNWTVKKLADMCNLSEYRFMHKFKEYTGYSPIDYCIMIKMEHAKTMLVETGMNITEISEQLGYKSSLYFSRVFKQYSGVSPSQFRNGKN